MIKTLNAIDACYEAPRAITDCSGLDDTCYVINGNIDVQIKFHSYDGECHTISLTMRVNRETQIDILFSRDTVNQYDIMSFSPFAFGISPQLSIENKTKRDARQKEYDAREALRPKLPAQVYATPECRRGNSH